MSHLNEVGFAEVLGRFPVEDHTRSLLGIGSVCEPHSRTVNAVSANREQDERATRCILYEERRTDLKDGLDKRPGCCWHPQGCNGDITVHMRVDVLQHAGPKRHATSPEDRREAWAELAP